jgi:MHS family alpha-ketoglutarate permease-like MFS transporter
MQKFLKLSVGLNDNQTTLVTGASLVFALCLQPLYGALSDRIGRKPLLVWFGVTGTLGTIPLLYLLQSARSALTAFLLIAAAWLIVAGYTSINAVVKAELFPTRVRATGVGLPYAVTVSIFGGTAEPIALWFKSIGHETWFYYYLTAVIATSLLVYVGMRDTKHASAIGRHE